MTHSLQERAEFILDLQSANQSCAPVKLASVEEKKKKHYHNLPEMQSINVENESYYQNKLDQAETLAKKGDWNIFLMRI